MSAKYERSSTVLPNRFKQAGLVLMLCLAVIEFPNIRLMIQAQTLPSLPTQIEAGKTPADITVLEIGSRVVGWGDYNGDGIDDLLTSNDLFRGSPDSLEPLRGGIFFGREDINSPAIVNLATDQPDLLITFQAESPLGSFAGIRSLEDMNGDNIDDLILDVTGIAGSNGQVRNASYIVFGSANLQPGMIDSSELRPDVTILRKPLSVELQVVFEGMADVNGDGAKDILYAERRSDPLIIGSFTTISILLGPFASGAQIDIESKPADAIIKDITGFETGTITLAEINGDRCTDIIVGRPGIGRPGRIEAGQINIFMGSPDIGGGIEISTSQNSNNVVIYGAVGGGDFGFGDHLGGAVASADVNGDGISDILLGVPNRAGAEEGSIGFAGEAYVIFGSPSLPGSVIDLRENQQDITIRGADGSPSALAVGDLLGAGISARDINGDRIMDIQVGAMFADGRNNKLKDSGEAYVILGSQELKSGTTIEIKLYQQDITIFGDREEGRLGFLFGGRFDFNGDKISEIVFRGLKTGDASSGNHIALNIYFGGEIRPPEIKKAKFKKGSSKLVVIGTDFTGASQIEINGVIIDREVKFVPDKSRLILKGNKRDLNLRSGQNQVRVIRKGAHSNTVTLNL